MYYISHKPEKINLPNLMGSRKTTSIKKEKLSPNRQSKLTAFKKGRNVAHNKFLGTVLSQTEFIFLPSALYSRLHKTLKLVQQCVLPFLLLL